MFFPVFPTLGVQNLFFPGRYLPVNTTVKTGYRPKPSNPAIKVFWHSFQGKVYWNTQCAQDINTQVVFGMYTFEITAISLREWRVNSLTHGKFEWNFRYVIFKRILVIDGWGISGEIALKWIWMSLDFTDDQSALVQVMAWCRQATSHSLSQCWPRSMSPYIPDLGCLRVWKVGFCSSSLCSMPSEKNRCIVSHRFS